ncbi:MAG TPA: hypothetical protein VLA95_07950 [Gemmatimonadales bacterium]|nr:hypothetical protein [Gemmatimonadales bacterium]HSE28150.1 hypothetical protein [Gemmatimonadales bacterium]
MNRHGSALLGALWFSVLLAGATAAALASARLGSATTANRLALARGAWAAEGCLAVAQARYAADGLIPSAFHLELGDGVGCRAEAVDPGARVQLNLAGPEQLEAILGRPDLAAALLDWRDADELPRAGGAERAWYDSLGATPPRNGPLASVDELRLVRGFDDSVIARVRPLVTVRGEGRVSLNAAPEEVLATVPGFGAEVVEVIVARRNAGGRWTGLEELHHAVAPGVREAIGARFQELAGLVQPEGPRMVLEIEATGPESPVRYRMDVTVAPAGSRLAVISREVR